MSDDAHGPLEARLTELERRFEVMLEMVADRAGKSLVKVLTDQMGQLVLQIEAMQNVLETKRVLTDSEVVARMQAIKDAGELEMEYGDDPQFVRTRELRRYVKFLQDKLAQQPPEGEG